MSIVIGSAENHGSHPEPGRRQARPGGTSSPPNPVGHGPRNMPRTIACIHCGATLNLPEGAEGRRLKCPKCGEKFKVESAGPQVKPAPLNFQDPQEGNPDSTLLLTKKPSTGDLDLPNMPTAAGNLRETFDLPMMTEADTPKKSKSAVPPTGADADALALFQDSPQPRRKKTGAEARANARRCPTCNSVVPAGMSLCQSCGLDLDTGTRVDLTDDLTPPLPPQPAMPIPMAVVGGLCLTIAIALSAFAVVKWQEGVEGGIYFIPIALFGVWAAVQFLRGKTAKLLLVALTLGALVDIAFLVAFPIYKANFEETKTIERRTTTDDPESDEVQIKPLAERLDTGPVFRGLGILVLYAGVSVYLMSPQVHRQMKH